MKSMHPLIAAAFAALILPAAAESADRGKEIVVGADRLTADDNNKTRTLQLQRVQARIKPKR